jgi:RimJ/RimL family protein N-acetyltransferase
MSNLHRQGVICYNLAMGENESEQTRSTNLHEVLAFQNIQVREGVVLRPLDASDATRILEILDTDTTIRSRVSVASKMHTSDDVEDQVENYRKDSHLIRYAIIENDNPIGLVSFWRDIDNPFDAPDNPDDYGFGFFLDPSKRGKGIVTNAVRNLMEVATKNLRVNRFIAYTEDDNQESIAVLNKLGFQPTGTVLAELNSGWSERSMCVLPDKCATESSHQYQA